MWAGMAVGLFVIPLSIWLLCVATLGLLIAQQSWGSQLSYIIGVGFPQSEHSKRARQKL